MDVAKLRIIGIDAEEGLAYCADDEEFYDEMLDEYVHESREKLEELIAAFGSRDWDRYRISAHSLKSTSRMVGAKDISGKAYELEIAAKAGDESAIEALHSEFVDECARFADALETYWDKGCS